MAPRVGAALRPLPPATEALGHVLSGPYGPCGGAGNVTQGNVDQTNRSGAVPVQLNLRQIWNPMPTK